MKIKFLKNLIKRHNRNTTPNLVSGFTIVEALVAIFILTLSVAAMLGVTASSISSARYANNEITANYLLQEAIDSVRSSRDTIAFQKRDDGAGYGWAGFLNKYGYPNSRCFSSNGCDVDMKNFGGDNITTNDIVSCSSSGCDPLYYYNDSTSSIFYSHDTNLGNASVFKRTIKMQQTDSTNPDQIKIIATVDWTNGTLNKSQSLTVYLLNWQK